MTEYTRKKISELNYVEDIENVEIIGKVFDPIMVFPSINRYSVVLTNSDQSSLAFLCIVDKNYPQMKEIVEEAYKSNLKLVVRGDYTKLGYISVTEIEITKQGGELSLVDSLEGTVSIVDKGNEGKLSLK